MAVQSNVLGAVVALVMLFVGIFMISQVAGVTPEDQLLDYTYTDVTNSTSLTGFNTTTPQNHTILLGAFADKIKNEDYNHKLEVTVVNSNSTASHTVGVFVEGTQIGDVNAANGTTTTKTFKNVGKYNGSANNTVEYDVSIVADDITVTEAVASYASGQQDSDFGSIQTQLENNTQTIYNVMVLALIIVILALAIGYLRGFGGGGTTLAQ